MTRNDILEAVKCFLGVLDEREHFEDRERALRAALDRLALAYHYSDAPFDDTKHPDAPTVDDMALRECIAPLFPELGLYNEALNIADKVGEPALGVGDAIDDLTDIASSVFRNGTSMGCVSGPLRARLRRSRGPHCATGS